MRTNFAPGGDHGNRARAVLSSMPTLHPPRLRQPRPAAVISAAISIGIGLGIGSPLAAQSAPAARGASAPPNAPAIVIRGDSTLLLRYDGAVVFEGTLSVRGEAPVVNLLVDSSGGSVTQVVKVTARGRGGGLTLRARLNTSG